MLVTAPRCHCQHHYFNNKIHGLLDNYLLTPLSANINAPASITKSDDSSSLTTAAVKPAADDAFPDVYTALGENSETCFKN